MNYNLVFRGDSAFLGKSSKAQFVGCCPQLLTGESTLKKHGFKNNQHMFEGEGEREGETDCM